MAHTQRRNDTQIRGLARQAGVNAETIASPASLLIGILLVTCISFEVREAFSDTCTTHIIAISGFKLLPIDALQKDRLDAKQSSELTTEGLKRCVPSRDLNS
ncbi:MAG: hypothetical protein ABFS45_25075 [Pseudomonadota bacterium]